MVLDPDARWHSTLPIGVRANDTSTTSRLRRAADERKAMAPERKVKVGV